MLFPASNDMITMLWPWRSLSLPLYCSAGWPGGGDAVPGVRTEVILLGALLRLLPHGAGAYGYAGQFTCAR